MCLRIAFESVYVDRIIVMVVRMNAFETVKEIVNREWMWMGMIYMETEGALGNQ